MRVYIIRAFVGIRDKLAASSAILKRLAGIDRTLLIQGASSRDIYQKLKPLIAPPPPELTLPGRQTRFRP